MAKKTQPVKRGPTKSSGRAGKRNQPEAAILKSKKASKVASRRVAGAQRAAQARQQKRRDSH